MNRHIQLNIAVPTSEVSDLLIAALSEAGAEGFEESENLLKVFIPEANYDAAAVKALTDQYNVQYETAWVEEQNWNALWESNFQPVVVDDPQTGGPWVYVRADFHPELTGVVHEIRITPKMSFGTGHHATTYLVMQAMQSIGFVDKTVFDFGTGTGILAILAEKMGAANVLATDNDEWSIANAEENLERNHCSHIRVELSDIVPAGEFDIVLANINKNVLLTWMAGLSRALRPGGILLLSGLLEADEADIREAAQHEGLVFDSLSVRNGWIALRFHR